MKKAILILICVLLLIINIAVYAVTFSKAEYQKRMDNILNKAASYTAISYSDRVFVQQHMADNLNALEKLMNDPNVPDEIKRHVLSSLNESFSSMEQGLNDPNISAAQKIAEIKAILQEIKTGTVVQQNKGATTTASGNFSPAQKTTSCAVGQNIEGMCVYALPSYNVSLDVAKSRCANYGMSFATRDQVKTLSKHSAVIYKGYPGEAGSIFVDGSVSGSNTNGSYYTVLCVKDLGNTTTASGNFSPVQKTTSCAVGQNIEGMCVYALPSYNVSLDVAKSRCANYGMSFATRDQVKTLSKHSAVIYKGYPGEAGSIFVDGSVSGINTSGSYYTVLCVKRVGQ